MHNCGLGVNLQSMILANVKIIFLNGKSMHIEYARIRRETKSYE